MEVGGCGGRVVDVEGGWMWRESGEDGGMVDMEGGRVDVEGGLWI